VATEGPLGGSALNAARAEGIPAASGFHTRFDHYTRHYGLGLITPLVRQHLRRFHQRAATTLVPTQSLASELATLGIDNARVLHRAVDPHRFHPRFRDPVLRSRWGACDDTPVALYVGRIAAEKNLQLAVRGFRALQARAPRARFVWVGDGPARAELQAAHPDFIFARVQRGEALARHYASSDLFIFPSLSETFGNVILEALASGVPAVAFDEGAARQHLQDGINGRAVPCDRSAAFVQACVSLADTEQRRSMQQAARQSVAGLTPDSMVDAFEAVLRGIRPPSQSTAPPPRLPPGALS
jgi:glycosyltransferase involved in cell wall biosynthesis